MLNYRVVQSIAFSLIHITAQCSLSQKDARMIGSLIWQNEGSKRIDYLAYWSPHESFPSLGIGHFIWLQKDSAEPYTEQFPALCTYLKDHGAKLPAWLESALQTGAPWQSRAAFVKDTMRVNELRTLMAQTIDLQTQFILKQLDKQWALMLKATHRKDKKHIITNYELLRASALGNYALADYLNFKGSGLNTHEASRGQRWGLLQVLLDMPDDLTIETAPSAFAISASQMLLNRIRNAAPNYTLTRYLHPWIKRVSTYADASLMK